MNTTLQTLGQRTTSDCKARQFAGWLTAALIGIGGGSANLTAADRDQSDSDARFIHRIDLYDADYRKIAADSTTPYSPLNTCGRCHDYDQISHGWHFNAFESQKSESIAGRQGEPWIWTDPRTGTQLPLSYRDWPGLYHPEKIGIGPWEMTRQFGDRVPGGNMGVGPAKDQKSRIRQTSGDKSESTAEDQTDKTPLSPRWAFSGGLEIDCMICHAVSGAYDFNERRRQIRDENFAWAPTAGLALGQIDGRVSRIKSDADPEDEETKDRMPTVTYDGNRFAADSKVFFDLIRQPSNNACYQCHSNRIVSDQGIEPDWIHDDDVHLNAGMECVDCHRNGIDHHISRGFDGEVNPGGHDVTTLSCAGCHLGKDSGSGYQADVADRPGRLGSPQPAHAGLPPVHFQKLTCTACHGGPAPRDQALRIMTSLAHGLGEKGHRSGFELPAILGPVYVKNESGRIAPTRAIWPAFWGTLDGTKVTPIPPDQAYGLTRRILRARKSFADEILNPKLDRGELKAILGEDRAKAKPDEWSEDEQEKVAAAQADKGSSLFSQRVFAALQAIEKELGVDQAVYVSSGVVYARGDQPDTLTKVDIGDDRATDMIDWPLVHQIRPAGWSLGVGGCTECHSDDAKIFASTVAAIGPGPDRGEPITMASLQGIDADQRAAWNALFDGRKSFKFVIASSIIVLALVLLVGICSAALNMVKRAS